ncbi:DUF262 domain-containing protein [[Mycoplasma] gypis]|uniref:DUF262 domain-containing HNH endonuclease family protein n=1 Tax=[Mycoplasma] gypis TaxID=92404 RepID=A0ABZ2RP61_9BACT|nr:DUF262 domain-containing protein [[Mycoplasma] gypis]MBN0919045.1 DUF262 domain-containing protein [[Mycoplasma] gypis]
MEIKKITLGKYLDTWKKLIVPAFQRDYCWEEQQIQEIFEKIQKSKKNIFLGMITLKKEGDDTFSIIDGQQRLTTLFLILLFLINFQNIANNDHYNIIFKNQNDYTQFKNINDILKKMKNKEEVIDLFVPKNNFMENAFLTIKNYYQKIVSNYQEAHFLVEKIKNIEMGLILLDDEENDDNPSEIYRTINATGKKLSQVDLIKNFLLMNDINDENFEKWKKIDNILKNDTKDKELFFLNYLVYDDNASQLNIKKTYDYFLNVDKYRKQNKTFILNNLNKYLEMYKILLNQKYDKYNERINNSLENWREVNMFDAAPFLIKVMEKYDNKKIDEEEFTRIVDLITSYQVRIQLSGKNANTKFLFKKLDEIIETEMKISQQNDDSNKKRNILLSDFLSDFLRNSIEKRGYRDAKLISDDELLSYLEVVPFYVDKKSNKFAKFILNKIETFESQEKIKILNYDDIQLEHIMPRILDKENIWKNELGIDWEKIHNENLHLLGNITLTAKNQEISNKSFAKKKALYKESKYSNINNSILNKNKWTENEIKNRTKLLVDKITKIYPVPKLKNVKREEKTLDKTITINTADENITGFKISKIKNEWFYLDKPSVALFFKSVAKELYKYYPEKFKELCESDECKFLITKEFFENLDKTSKVICNLDKNVLLDFHGSSKELLRRTISLIKEIDEKLLEDFKIEIKSKK